jgi:tetratricopeptide (TPR) repeat protein
VNEPEPFENMLIQKRYAALWPKLQELGGAHLGEVRAAALASAQRAYAEAPEDMQRLQEYVAALRHAGRLEDAIALKSKLPSTPQAMAAADEQTGWVVNEIAYALNEAGRGDEGDRLFAMLNDPPRTDAGWRVSMFINRLEMLTSAGKFEKAAGLLDATELSAKNDGNPYARQLVRRLRYCILSSMGRKDEAAKVLPEVLKHADDALQPTVEGLLCAGDADKAEQLVLQALDNPDEDKREFFEERFVRALQPVPLTDDDPSVWQNSWKALRQRTAIAAAFDRLGRELPSALLPEKSTGIAQK